METKFDMKKVIIVDRNSSNLILIFRHIKKFMRNYEMKLSTISKYYYQ